MSKSKRKSAFALALTAALLAVLFNGVAAPAAKAGAGPSASSLSKNSMQAVVEAMQPGWNLGNTLDATGEDETSWGNPRVTKELIQSNAAQGYKSIRIPVTWDVHLGDAPNYQIEPAYLDRVQEVVDWALDAKLYVMINLHHDSWLWVSHMEKNHDEVLAATMRCGNKSPTGSKIIPPSCYSKASTSRGLPTVERQTAPSNTRCCAN